MSGLIANPTGQFQDPLCQQFPELVLETALEFPFALALGTLRIPKTTAFHFFQHPLSGFHVCVETCGNLAIGLKRLDQRFFELLHQKCIFISLLLQVFQTLIFGDFTGVKH
jgi:hypothetical protein